MNKNFLFTVHNIHFLDKLAEDLVARVLLPLLGLHGEPGEGLRVSHEEGVVTNKAAQIGFLLLVGPDRADVQFLVELGLEREALHAAPRPLKGIPGGPGNDGVVLHRHHVLPMLPGASCFTLLVSLSSSSWHN